ncbi:aminotransferase class III-fold pyridoxal phosphate-dependent enzyme [Mycobacterium sp. DL99]|uniref:aspartate aminotransferase family protein n=1 Tax=Mycobacterium sp. DL99 TaxID=2528957 RepID=UPI0010819AE7|nr:aminotransferase class III-fold pyridoxal phosphate-dependent enzyme [Mycobacterium sp. DL99]
MTALHPTLETRPPSEASDLLLRRQTVLGRHTPLFYREPLQIVAARGVEVTGSDGRTYLDAYNNVPHVGHCHPAIIEAISQQMSTVNVHSRYLTDTPIEYAERLLSLFPAPLDMMFFTNSGSEANDLALRLARFHTRSTGVLVSDHSYHGNTQALVSLTTGLPTSEPLGAHIRTFTAPDNLDPSFSVEDALLQIDHAIAELQRTGHGVAAVLFDPLFSTEGLPQLPPGYLDGLCARVRQAGGLVIADEVQSGLGRTADYMWGFEATGFVPDLAVLGKPMGNGFPLGAVIAPADLIESFSEANLYFNTFATSPAAGAAGLAVLHVMETEKLMLRAQQASAMFAAGMQDLVDGDDRLVGVRGAGMFLGMQFVDPHSGESDGPTARAVVEAMRANGVLIGRVGRRDEVLKIRPPLAFDTDHADFAVNAFAKSLAQVRR